MKKSFIALLVLLGFVSCKKEIKSPIELITEIFKTESPVALDSTQLKTKYPTVFDFYKNNNFKTVWFEKNNRKAFIDFVKQLDEDGLNPIDYNLEIIQSVQKPFDSLSEAELMDLDAQLTAGFIKAANHLHNGKINPNTFYSDWEIKQTNTQADKLLNQALKKQKIAFVLDSLRPKNRIYARLRESLKAYKNQNTDTTKAINQKIVADKKIVLEDSTSAILAIKNRLAYLNFYQNSDSLSAVYTTDLEDAVKAFQKTHNLTPDGIIGSSTIKALNHNKDYRKKQIIANLERFRWYPDSLGTNYVMVNIPEFRLWFVQDGDTVVTKKIIVGKEARKTAILSSKFSDIVFNPTWTVPPTILKKDLTPAASKDLSYFSRNKIKIYKDGAVVDPEDWNPKHASQYRYVQDPGSHNSLGLIKFNFPNNHAVYLHDTNHKSGFGRDGRDLSSGCIRVNEPFDLATIIFEVDGNKNMTKAKMDELIAEGKTKSIRVKNPIYVHQFYWTVSLNENNEIQFNEDIYNLDIALYQALQI
ncbi:L,D-transpeptidase family protein [Flavobacterium agricola]|uniref:L,D-transpeptidase family protein n=1 Tax=Flavobacterium agricola TaxID=2870839 RepID=A0ABY6LWG4_9FLAO|nr:L,D-transpeptidase family protein [Flavobacterium agricola]UYW00678.1 L,D-transpeptidase family protein [Flavobacterium agricola]